MLGVSVSDGRNISSAVNRAVFMLPSMNTEWYTNNAAVSIQYSWLVPKHFQIFPPPPPWDILRVLTKWNSDIGFKIKGFHSDIVL